MASVPAAALPALPGVRLDGDPAPLRPPVPAPQAGREGQALQTGRRPARISGLPAALGERRGRSLPRLPRGRLFPGGLRQHARLPRLEPGRRPRTLLPRRTRGGLLAGARHPLRGPLQCGQGEMVQQGVPADETDGRACGPVCSGPGIPRGEGRGMSRLRPRRRSGALPCRP